MMMYKLVLNFKDTLLSQLNCCHRDSTFFAIQSLFLHSTLFPIPLRRIVSIECLLGQIGKMYTRTEEDKLDFTNGMVVGIRARHHKRQITTSQSMLI